MSMYPSQQDLYKAKAEYYEKAFYLAMGMLCDYEYFRRSKEYEGDYYCVNSGDLISEFIE